jgi:flagellar biogenesis protein FliO
MIDIYLHMGVALILVSGLIFLLGLFFKKRQDKESLMKIMGYQSLGPKKGIAMVKVGPEVLLVGVTATDIKLLKAMDAIVEGQETEAPQQREKTPNVITADVSEKLQKLRALKGALKDSLYAIK